MKFGIEQAEEFVAKNAKRGYRWEGWTIVRWVKNPGGYSMPNGAYRNGVWGVEFRTPVSEDGTWSIDRV